MGQLISRGQDTPDWSDCINHFESINIPKYVIHGEFEKVKRLINGGCCDVNMNIDHGGNHERPLSIAIKSIKEENDNFFELSQFLLNCKDIHVNAKNKDNLTLLGYMCSNEHPTILGVELLLNNHRTKVNARSQLCAPLLLTLRNVEIEDDYFYKITSLLLSHKDIHVNDQSMLEFMCENECKSTLGVQILLKDNRTKVNARMYSPLYFIIYHKHFSLLKEEQLLRQTHDYLSRH